MGRLALETITGDQWKGPKAAAVSGCQQWGTLVASSMVLKFLPVFLFYSGVFLLLTVRLILRPLYTCNDGRNKTQKNKAHCILSLALVKDWGLEPAEDSLLKLLVHSSCHWSGNGSAPAGNDSTEASAAKDVLDLFQDVSHLKGVREAPEKIPLPLSLSNASGLFLLRCENWDKCQTTGCPAIKWELYRWVSMQETQGEAVLNTAELSTGFLLDSELYDHTAGSLDLWAWRQCTIVCKELLPRMTGTRLSSRCQSAKAFGDQASVKVNQASWIWPDCYANWHSSTLPCSSRGCVPYASHTIS